MSSKWNVQDQTDEVVHSHAFHGCSWSLCSDSWFIVKNMEIGMWPEWYWWDHHQTSLCHFHWPWPWLGVTRAAQSKTSWLHFLSRWPAFSCFGVDLVESWYDDRYYWTLQCDTSLLDFDLHLRWQEWEKAKSSALIISQTHTEKCNILWQSCSHSLTRAAAARHRVVCMHTR